MKKILLNCVDWVGKKFNIDIKYLIKSGAHFYSSNAVNLVLRLVLSIFLVRLLSKYVYGRYGFVLAVIDILSIATMPGLRISMKREVALGNDYSFIIATKKRFLYGIWGILGVLIVGLFFFLRGDLILAHTFWLSSLLFLPYFILTDFQHYFIGKKDFKRASWFYTFLSLFSIIIIIGSLFISKDLRWIIFITLASMSVGSIFIFFKIKKGITNKNNNENFISYGKNITVMELFQRLGFYADRLIIPYFASFTTLANYLVATIIPSHMKEGMKLFSEILFPKFSKEDSSNSYSRFKNRFGLILLLSTMFAIIMIILIPFLLPLIYSRQYNEAILPAQIIAVGTSLLFPGVIISYILQAQKKQKELYKLNIFSFISTVLLLITLVPFYGLIGAAIAVTLSRALYTVYSWRLISQIA